MRPFRVAYVDLLILVDRDAGHLRQYVRDRGIIAARQVGNILRRHSVSVGTGGGDAIWCANQAGLDGSVSAVSASSVIEIVSPALRGKTTILFAGLKPDFRATSEKTPGFGGVILNRPSASLVA